MQRYNLFCQLHKGLQSLLSDTARMLQKTNFSNETETGAAIGRLGRFLRVLNDLAWLEETCLFPRIEKFTPATVFVLEQDHLHNRAGVQRLKYMMKVFNQSASQEEKLFAGKMLVNGFTELMILVLRHFTKEENMVNTTLWDNFSCKEIAELEQEIVSCISPEDLVLYNIYNCRHLPADELYTRLQQLETATGLQAFHELSAGTEHLLAAIHLQPALENFTEQVLVA